MRKKILLLGIIMLLLFPAVVYAGDHGDGSRNTNYGGYGSGLYWCVAGSCSTVTTGTGWGRGGNIGVGYNFITNWGAGGLNMYFAPRSTALYGKENKGSDVYRTTSRTITKGQISNYDDSKAYVVNIDAYYDNLASPKLSSIYVTYGSDKYTLQQAINAKKLDNMVVIGATGLDSWNGSVNTNNYAMLNGGEGYAIGWNGSGRWGNNNRCGEGETFEGKFCPDAVSNISLMFVIKAGQFPDKIEWKETGEWAHWQVWRTDDGDPVITLKDDPTITAPTGKEVVYNGKAHSIFTNGSSNSEPMQYSLDNKATWSQSIGTRTNAGSYNLYYKVDGNDTFNEVSATGPVVGTIKPATITVTAPDQTYTYNGQAQGKAITAKTVDGVAATIKYGTSSGSYTLDAAPKITNVSESNKTIYYKVTAPNHADYTGQYKLIMNPRDINEASASDIQKQIYSGNALTPAITLTDLSKTLAENTDFTKEYSSNKLPLGTSSGKGTITITGKGNYYKTKTVNFDIEAKKVNISFNPLGGTEVAAIERYYGMPYGDLTPSTRIGYNFTTWNNARTDGDVITKDTYVTNPEDHMLFARWEIIYYSLQYELYGIGHLEDPIGEFTVEDIIDLPIPVNEGDSFHTFENWHLDSPEGPSIRTIRPEDTVKRIQDTGDGDLIVHAKWVVNKYEGNIRAYGKGGEEIKNEEVRREYYNTALYHLEYKLEGGETTCEVDLVED